MPLMIIGLVIDMSIKGHGDEMRVETAANKMQWTRKSSTIKLRNRNKLIKLNCLIIAASMHITDVFIHRPLHKTVPSAHIYI